MKHFKYLSCDITYEYSHDIQQFTSICGTITRTLKQKTTKKTELKLRKTCSNVQQQNVGNLKKAESRAKKKALERGKGHDAISEPL